MSETNYPDPDKKILSSHDWKRIFGSKMEKQLDIGEKEKIRKPVD